ncbi:hypothetical protein FACS1894190_08820 [Spirochaetia bacterium]|nr:hypothetical protein FACS1894190_08820 [Spirochaetia bacterium]
MGVQLFDDGGSSSIACHFFSQVDGKLPKFVKVNSQFTAPNLHFTTNYEAQTGGFCTASGVTRQAVGAKIKNNTLRLFSYIDVLMRQLMEYPESVMDAFVARVLSEGADCRGELVSMMRDGLGRIIAGAKDQVIKELNSLKGKYTGNDKIDEISETIREAVGND